MSKFKSNAEIYSYKPIILPFFKQDSTKISMNKEVIPDLISQCIEDNYLEKLPNHLSVSMAAISRKKLLKHV
jgi:hypothetical protein